MLKKYLQTLIESVFTNKKQWIGRQGFIGGNAVAICNGAFTFNGYKYIAPADGYIFLDSGDGEIHSMVYIQGAGLAYANSPSGERHAVWAPVFAGQIATLSTYPTYCSRAFCQFVPLAGEN